MTAMNRDIEAEIRNFLTQAMPHLAEDLAHLPATANLWDVADSLKVLDLLQYLEHRYSFSLAALDFMPENIGTIERIVTLVAKKRRPDTG